MTKVTINKKPSIRTVGINAGSQNRVKTISVGAATSVSTLNDVDASDADDGETLVWDDVLKKYVVKAVDINGGNF